MIPLQRYGWAIHLALITLGLYIGTDIFWAIVAARTEVDDYTSSLAQLPAVPAQEKRPFQEYAVIVDRNLFGANAHSAAPTSTPSPPGATKIRSFLKVVGTVVGQAEHTYAIIEDLTNNQQRLYRVGDHIRAATILETTRHRVLLDHQGQREELWSFRDWEVSAPASSLTPVQALMPAETRPVRRACTARRDHRRVYRNLHRLRTLIRCRWRFVRLAPTHGA